MINLLQSTGQSPPLDILGVKPSSSNGEMDQAQSFGAILKSKEMAEQKELEKKASAAAASQAAASSLPAVTSNTPAPSSDTESASNSNADKTTVQAASSTTSVNSTPQVEAGSAQASNSASVQNSQTATTQSDKTTRNNQFQADLSNALQAAQGDQGVVGSSQNPNPEIPVGQKPDPNVVTEITIGDLQLISAQADTSATTKPAATDVQGTQTAQAAPVIVSANTTGAEIAASSKVVGSQDAASLKVVASQQDSASLNVVDSQNVVVSTATGSQGVTSLNAADDQLAKLGSAKTVVAKNQPVADNSAANLNPETVQAATAASVPSVATGKTATPVLAAVESTRAAAVKETGKITETTSTSKSETQTQSDNPLSGMMVASTNPVKETIGSKSVASFSTVQTQVAATDVVQQVLNQMKGTLQTAPGSMRVQLNPKDLGSIDIQMVKTGQGINVTFVAEQASTGRLLETQIDQLRQSLSNSGIQLSGLNISQHGQSGQQSGFFKQAQQYVQGNTRNVVQTDTKAEVASQLVSQRTSGLLQGVDYRI